MQNSGFRRTISYLVYMALVWVVLDGIVAFSGFLVPEERVRWFSEFYMPDSVLGFRIRPRLKDFQLS